MAKPHFTPRQCAECPLCNAIMMVRIPLCFQIRPKCPNSYLGLFIIQKLISLIQMIWNLRVDVNCNSCGRKFYAPKHNVQSRTDPSSLNDAEDASILHQLDEFQMNCTNEWCSFTVCSSTYPWNSCQYFTQLHMYLDTDKA